jgi:hypothetical protein
MVQIARPSGELETRQYGNNLHHTRHNVTDEKNLEWNPNIPFSREHLKLLKIHTASNPLHI